jgi:hypothetical protein
MTSYHLCRNHWDWIAFARNYFHYPFQNCMLCTTHVWKITCPFEVFILAIPLSVLFRYTDYDYPFGIFKVFLQIRISMNTSLQQSSWLLPVTYFWHIPYLQQHKYLTAGRCCMISILCKFPIHIESG